MVGMRNADARGPSATKALLEALALATLANTHAQLAAIDSVKPAPTTARWRAGSDEPDGSVRSLEYHESGIDPVYLLRQRGGGWLWSTRQETDFGPRAGSSWHTMTGRLIGYFTEVKR
jgi:hypothetical protein